MKRKYWSGLIVGLTMVMASCGGDDDTPPSIPPRLLAEQAPEDDINLVEFLQTHFYEVVDDTDGRFDIVIDTIAGENADRTPLFSLVSSETINVSSDQVGGLTEEEVDVPHTLYYIKLRERNDQVPSPTIADSALVKYEGQTLEGNKFDASSVYLWQQLPFTLRGYASAIANLKPGSNLVNTGDGSAYYSDSEIGLFFLPSGLAYYNRGAPSGGIGAYESLIFQIELGSFVENTDSDNDGIPSILEDINQNGFLGDDNTDVESEERAGGGQFTPFVPDFQDADDDDDGVPTRTEISDENGNIIIPYPDTNGDGTPDYLDPDIARDPNNN